MNVTVTGNSRVVAEIIKRKALRSGPAWKEAAQGIGDDWLKKCRALSAVQYASTRDLKRMGHPYATRHFTTGGAGARNALPAPAKFINRQRGRLFTGWLLQIQQLADAIAIRITNSAPYFIYLHFGTRKMIARPILSAALALAERERQSRYERAQKRIHGYGG